MWLHSRGEIFQEQRWVFQIVNDLEFTDVCWFNIDVMGRQSQMIQLFVLFF